MSGAAGKGNSIHLGTRWLHLRRALIIGVLCSHLCLNAKTGLGEVSQVIELGIRGNSNPAGCSKVGEQTGHTSVLHQIMEQTSSSPPTPRERRAWNCADASLSPAELAQAAPALAAWAIVQLGMLLTASQSLEYFVSYHKLGHFNSKAVDQSQLSINRFQGEHAGIWRTFCGSK